MDAGYAAKPNQQWPLYGGGALDRTSVVTASEIGICARQVKFAKAHMNANGYDPEEGTGVDVKQAWGFFERGHNVESWVVETLRRGWPADSPMQLMHTGKQQVSFMHDYQSGTPDGVFIDTTSSQITVGILEIKSMDPRTNVRYLPKLNHVDQVMQNLDLVAAEFGALPIGGEIIYIDASDYKRRFPFHIKWDEAHAVRLETRARWIMEAAGPEDLPAEGLFKDGCKYCAFTTPCTAIVMKEKNEKGTTNGIEVAANQFFGQLKSAAG
jgi:hypothetical protein